MIYCHRQLAPPHQTGHNSSKAGFRKEKKPRRPRHERLEIPADAWEKCEACDHTDITEKFVPESQRLPQLRTSPENPSR